MATHNGNLITSGSYSYRVRAVLTGVRTPTAGETSIPITLRTYIVAGNRIIDNENTYTRTSLRLGNTSASKAISTPSGGGTQLLEEITKAVPVSASPTGVTVTVSLAGINIIPGTSSVTFTETIPARPATAPPPPPVVTMALAPAGASSPRRVINWTAPASGTVTGYRIELWSASNGAWGHLGTTDSAARSAETGVTVDNDRYQARVYAVGTGGSLSTPTISQVIVTRPTAPTSVTATRAGANITLTFTDTSSWNDEFEIWGSQNGGTYTLLATIANSGASPWTHIAPDPDSTWQYQVRSAVTASLSGTSSRLTSPPGASNVVAGAAPPLAPAPLSPIGVAVDRASGPVRFAWRHQAVDSSLQTAAEVRARLVAGPGAWITGTATSDEWADLPLPTSGAYEWQARTRGLAASFGPWSALAQVAAAEPPQGSIASPADATSIPGDRVTVTVTGSPMPGTTLVRYDLELLDDAGIRLASYSAATSDTSITHTFAAVRLDNGAYYRIRLVVTDSNNLSSPPSENRFLVDYVGPATPTISATWQRATATVTLTATAGTDPAAPPTVYLRLERWTGRADDWEIVTGAEIVTSGQAVTDPFPPLTGPLRYRAIAVSALPSETPSLAVDVTQPRGAAAWLTTVDGQATPIPYNLALESDYDPRAVTHRVLGRRRPIAVFPLGTDPTRTIAFQGVTTPYVVDSPTGPRRDSNIAPGRPEEALVALLLGHVVFYRDPAGRAFWGAITGTLSYTPTPWGHDTVAFTITEIDYDPRTVTAL